ncbi:uncharacterized protein LOC111388305 [Olea europaea var. sylvestris]|uniref:uncharacterized protein LOC111388305 n=1 Tax=Olea europaea var. sylvestris TaxID=158386 RepID=UPI000C1D6485|nr:uncharacterized protein LOC111388305 [Olea europaea var. sylvestris]
MATAKFEVSQFDGKIDFDMWSQKMKAILMQMKCAKALDDSWPEGLASNKKFEREEIAWSTIFLYLSDNMIREIGETTTASNLWAKLKAKYETKTTPNKCFLLKQFFSFKIDPAVDLEENLILLNSISDKYKDIKAALEYGREELIVDYITNALRNKALEIKAESIFLQRSMNVAID